MTSSSPTADARPLFTAAAVSYLASCALGTAVATGLVRTGRARWVHHALYIATIAVSAAALSSPLWARSNRSARPAAVALLPAALPLALIPRIRSGTAGHVALGLSAAPFYARSVTRAWRR